MKEVIEQKGMISISDPACGAGGMLLACVEECLALSFDPRQVLQLHAQDIDRDCMNMTYIQLAALELQAIVIHGNTLTHEVWESRPTPQMRYFWHWHQENVEPELKLQQMLAMMCDVEQREAKKDGPPCQPDIILPPITTANTQQLQLDLGPSVE